MMKRFYTLIFTLILSTAIFAQKKLTLTDAVWNQWFALYPEHLDELKWQGDANNITYTNNYSEIKYATPKQDFKTLVTIEEINSELKKQGHPNIRYLYGITWIDTSKFYIIYKNNIIIYNVEKKKITDYIELPEDAEQIFFNPQTYRTAFVIENNLYWCDKNGKVTAITNDKDKGIVNGSDYVHRQEFGIDHGIFWSPQGNYLAFYRKDETMVNQYPLVDFTQFPAQEKLIRYPMTGQKSEQVTLGIYDFATGKTLFLEKKGDPEHYLTCITWGPQEKYIYIAELNRDQNFMQLNKYDIKSGKKIKTLFEEKNPKYVEPEHPLMFSPQGDKFLWYSERDGYQHLYLYDTEGNLIRQVTKGKWVVTDFYGFDPKGKFIYIQATAKNPIERHIYKVNVNTGEMTALTQVHGVHNAIFSKDKKYFVDKYSNIETPKVYDWKNSNGKTIKNILTSDNPLKDYKLGKMTINTLTAADGQTKLYYRIILPPDFDKTKKYPAIIYVYGGPHLQLITDSWLGNAWLWQYYMAQEGFIMLTLDNRGSDNRGFDFESVTFRHLGIEEMKDQMKGIEYLKSLPYVDTNRIGVHGWSFGGYMTISLMTTYPNVFKTGVAGGPVTDWKFYEVMYGERYMDTPQSNPEGYAETSLLSKIKNLKGKLMIIHGMVDPVVVPQNSMDLLLEAQKNNIQIDYYPYPNSEHNVAGRLRIHLMQKITDYFKENL